MRLQISFFLLVILVSVAFTLKIPQNFYGHPGSQWDSGQARMTVEAANLKSEKFYLDTNPTALPTTPAPSPTPTPFQIQVRTDNQDKKENKSLRLRLSTDILDFGPLSPTNPIKRELKISLMDAMSDEIDLMSFENHDLASNSQTLPDTSCDTGDCNEKTASDWINPLTFGFGYSFDDIKYQRFTDISKQENPQTKIISPGQELTYVVKLNISKDILEKDKKDGKTTTYQNVITFFAIPKI